MASASETAETESIPRKPYPKPSFWKLYRSLIIIGLIWSSIVLIPLTLSGEMEWWAGLLAFIPFGTLMGVLSGVVILFWAQWEADNDAQTIPVEEEDSETPPSSLPRGRAIRVPNDMIMFIGRQGKVLDVIHDITDGNVNYNKDTDYFEKLLPGQTCDPLWCQHEWAFLWLAYHFNLYWLSFFPPIGKHAMWFKLVLMETENGVEVEKSYWVKTYRYERFVSDRMEDAQIRGGTTVSLDLLYHFRVSRPIQSALKLQSGKSIINAKAIIQSAINIFLHDKDYPIDLPHKKETTSSTPTQPLTEIVPYFKEGAEGNAEVNRMIKASIGLELIAISLKDHDLAGDSRAMDASYRASLKTELDEQANIRKQELRAQAAIHEAAATRRKRKAEVAGLSDLTQDQKAQILMREALPRGLTTFVEGGATVGTNLNLPTASPPVPTPPQTEPDTK